MRRRRVDGDAEGAGHAEGQAGGLLPGAGADGAGGGLLGFTLDHRAFTLENFPLTPALSRKGRGRRRRGRGRSRSLRLGEAEDLAAEGHLEARRRGGAEATAQNLDGVAGQGAADARQDQA